MIDHLEIESTIVPRDSEEGRKAASMAPTIKTLSNFLKIMKEVYSKSFQVKAKQSAMKFVESGRTKMDDEEDEEEEEEDGKLRDKRKVDTFIPTIVSLLKEASWD